MVKPPLTYFGGKTRLAAQIVEKLPALPAHPSNPEEEHLMKIRLMGTETEIADALAKIATVLDVREASAFYPNRGASRLGRVYLDVAEPSGAATVHAEAERADRSGRGRIGGRKEIR